MLSVYFQNQIEDQQVGNGQFMGVHDKEESIWGKFQHLGQG